MSTLSGFNTLHYYLTQVRQRAYVVGSLPATGRKFHFPKPLAECVPIRKILMRKNRRVETSPCRTPAQMEHIAQVTRMPAPPVVPPPHPPPKRLETYGLGGPGSLTGLRRGLLWCDP